MPTLKIIWWMAGLEIEEHRLKPVLLVAGEVGGAEVEVGVEFAFEEGGAAFGVADVFGGVAAGAELNGDGATLEGGTEVLDALAMGVIEGFGDAENCSEAAGDALSLLLRAE